MEKNATKKKNKKAFTLVELIAIILVLSIILTVTFTSLSKSLSNSNDKEYQTLIKNLEMAAENYANLPGKYREIDKLLKEGKRVTINITDLIDAEIIDQIPINPKTNKETSGYILVEKNSNNELIYTVEIK